MIASSVNGNALTLCKPNLIPTTRVAAAAQNQLRRIGILWAAAQAH